METKTTFKSEISLFMLLFLTSSFTVTNDIISSAVTIGLWILTAAYLFLSLRHIDTVMFLPFVLIVLAVILSNIYNDEVIKNMISVIFSFVTVFFYANIYGYIVFKRSYIKLVKILCIVSLIGMVAFTIVPALENIAVCNNASGKVYSNFYIYTHPHMYDRNMGMFWEPGAFQTFIIIALLLEANEKKPNIKTIAIFIATIITTFSTTGYIGLALALLQLLSKNNQINSRLRGFVIFASLSLIVVLFFFSDKIFETSESTVFGKVINFFNQEEYNSSDAATSASVRYFAVIKPLAEFFKSPILGCGYSGLIERTLEYTYGMNTCTFVNWFAVYGIVYGTAMLIGIVKFTKKINKSGIPFLLTLITLFVATMSENYVNNATILLLALYGYKEYFIPEEEYEYITN